MTNPENPKIEESQTDKEANVIDQFIVDGGFDQAFQDAFGLPETVVKSLGEVA
ncbi:hypothetical protein [Acinetobacter guillouiae]|uniref:hypothetical protein n=1 Tax=Acinetobacter guillouiae TaxID=106649 RepID=UPI002FDA15DC